MATDWITFGQMLTFGQMVFRIFAAVLIGAVIGIDRQIKNRPAGMRTHVLVCLGAALIAMVQQVMIAQVAAMGSEHINVSVGRLTSAIVSGIGFLGAGTIIISQRKIMGLTTAASLWCTACLGLAVGAGFVTMAVAASAVVLLVLSTMQRIIRVNTYKRLQVQFVHRVQTLAFLHDVFQQMQVKVLDQDFHAETLADSSNLYTNVYSLTMPSGTGYQQIIERLMEHPNIRAVRTRNV